MIMTVVLYVYYMYMYIYILYYCNLLCRYKEFFCQEINHMHSCGLYTVNKNVVLESNIP